MQTDTTYLGLSLPHPFIAGASPFGYHIDTVKRLEDVGCAAVVLHSLFEEQIIAAYEGRIHHMDPAEPRFAQALAEFPPAADYAFGPDAYAEHVSRLKSAVKVPIIASLNGTSAEVWLRYATILEQAGADALELNLYEVVTDLGTTGAAVEHKLVGIAREVKRTLRIPVAVKVSPFFSAFGNTARQLDEAGVDALVLSIASISPISTSRRRSPTRSWSCRRTPSALTSSMAGDSLRSSALRACRLRRHHDAERRDQSHPGRCERRPIGVVPSASRPRVCADDAAGPGAVDGMASPEPTR